MKKLLTVLLCFGLAGCATFQNPFSEYYEDRTGGIDVSKSGNVILPIGEPKIIHGMDKKADEEKMWEEGYNLLGFSSFISGNATKEQLIAQAKKVKAEVVFMYADYANTISGAVPLTLPDNQIITTNSMGTSNSSGNIYGYQGSASYSGRGSYSGNSTSTIYGTKTTFIPFSQNRYACFAIYWIKMKKSVFGAIAIDLTSEQREKIGTNKGVFVRAVVNDSPAFNADIFKGDIITKVNDEDVFGSNSLNDITYKNIGKKVTLTIIRNDKTLTKEIQLSEGNVLEDEKYGTVPEAYYLYNSKDTQFHKTAKIDGRKVFDNYKRSKDAGLTWEQLSSSQIAGADQQIAEIFTEIRNVVKEYGIKNQYRAIYSVRFLKVNETEDITDTIISILNGK